MSPTNAQNNRQGIPTKNEGDPENVSLPKKQNQSHKPTRTTSVSNTAAE